MARSGGWLKLEPAVSIWADRLWWPVLGVTNWLLRKRAVFWGLGIFRAKPRHVLGQLQWVGHLTWAHIVQKLCFFALVSCNKTLMDLFNRFSYYWNCNAMLSRFSHVWLFATLWTIVHQVPLSMGFSREKYWSGLPFPSPGDLPDPGIKPMSLASSALAGGFFTTNATWEAHYWNQS